MFLQKVSKEKLKSIKKKDYKIFTAVIEKIGYDIRGRTVFKKDSHGNILKKEVDIVNYDGTVQKQTLPIIDTDIPEIIEEFKKFKRSEKIDW